MPRDGPNGRCQRAQAIKRRKAIWEALHPAEIQVGKICPPEIGYGKPPQHEQGFAAATATAAGMTKQAIKRRKQIWEALHPETGRNPPTLGGRGNTSFAAETEAVSGESKRRINEHLARADALGDDLERITGKVESDSTEAARVEGLRKGFATVCEGLPPRA